MRGDGSHCPFLKCQASQSAERSIVHCQFSIFNFQFSVAPLAPLAFVAIIRIGATSVASGVATASVDGAGATALVAAIRAAALA